VKRDIGPTRAELDAIEAELTIDMTADQLREQFPTDPPRGFEMARGDVEPRTELVYGKRRIVHRIANGPGVTRQLVEARLAALGIHYTELFATARFWCAAVTE
jgi:hypothetical protein